MEPPDEEGGVGDFGGKKFMWMLHGKNYVEACFESGETLRHENSERGWTEFYMWGLMVAKLL